MEMIIVLFVSYIFAFDRYNPFHPCREEGIEIGNFVNRSDEYDFFCYKNFGNLNWDDEQVLWREAEDICQDWHDDAHSCSDSDWYWLPVDENINLDYVDLKMSDPHNWVDFLCGDCDLDYNDTKLGCRYIDWCPDYCNDDGQQGSSGDDEGCAAMFDYGGTGSPYGSEWQDRSNDGVLSDWSNNGPTWNDVFCGYYMLNGIYDLPIDTICKMPLPNCYGFNSTDPLTCSSHGYCLHHNDCFCYEDYFGDQCEFIHTCDGERADDYDVVCNGVGNCTHQDHCVCNPTYFGEFCDSQMGGGSEFGTCSGDGFIKDSKNLKCYKNFGSGYTYEETSDLCNTWIQPPGTSLSEEWSQMLEIHSSLDEEFIVNSIKNNGSETGKIHLGLRKHPSNVILYPCPPPDGYYWDDLYSSTQYALAKGQSVLCLPPQTGEKKWAIGMGSGLFWEDHTMEDTGYDAVCQWKIPTCQGYVQDEIHDVCSSRGECVYEDTCVCHADYYGSYCEFHDCWGVRNDEEEEVCNQHGECIGPDWCLCDAGYFGSNCNETLCYFIPSTDVSSVCGGHGECVAYDTCYCDADWGLDDCSATYPCRETLVHPSPRSEFKINITGDRRAYCTDNCDPEEEVMGVLNVTEEGENDVCVLMGADHDTRGRGAALEYCQDYHSSFQMFSIRNLEEYNFITSMYQWQYGGNIHLGLVKPSPYTGDACYQSPVTWEDGTNATWFNTYLGWTINCDDIGNRCLRMWNSAGTFGDLICAQARNYMCGYRLSVCDGFRADDPNSCNQLGICWEDEKCTCFRNKGFLGDYCDYRTCDGVEGYEDDVCSGHGECVDSGHPTIGSCDCDSGWFGTNCSITICEGVLTNDTSGRDSGGLIYSGCSGHGECYGPEKCKCEYKYWGSNCEKSYCNWIRSDKDEVCNGHGDCWPADKCTCNNTVDEYWGDDCEYWFCHGLGSNEFEVCNGGGTCVGTDECRCLEGFYYEEECDVTTCDGIFSNDTNSTCSGRGDCWPYNTCDCEEGWYGYCDKPICFDIPSELNGTVCSGHGICSDPDTCQCESKWYGGNCEIANCFGVFSNETSKVCSGYGECIGQDNCSCVEGAEGKNCSLVRCNGIRAGDPGVCNDRGNCTSPETCECIYGWYSPSSFCEEYVCFGYDNLDSEVCNHGMGSCVGVDVCECFEDDEYMGIRCVERFPFSEISIEYRYDFFTHRRLIIVPYHLPSSLLTSESNTMVEWTESFEKIECDAFPGQTSTLGDDALVSFIVEGENVVEIQLEIGSDVDLLREGQTYIFSFKVQDLPDDTGRRSAVVETVFMFNYTVEVDELDYSDEDVPFIDNYDDPEDPLEEEEEDEEDIIDDEDGDGDSDEDGEIDNLSIILGSAGGAFALFVIIVSLLLLFCCVMSFCCICCCLVVAYCCLSKVYGKASDSKSPEEELFEMQMGTFSN